MAVDLTPSLLNKLKVRLENIFPGDQNVAPDTQQNPITLQGLLENQTAQITEGFKVKGGADGTNCLAREVIYLRPESETLPTASATPVALACDIPAGEGVSSFKKEFLTNIHIQDTLTIADKDCDNEFKFLEQTARGILGVMAKMTNVINRTVIGTLDTNKQTITAGNEESGTIGVGGDTIEFPASRFVVGDDGSIISEWETIAVSEFLSSNFLIMDGKNLNTAINQSRFQAFNDNGRASFARYTDGIHDIYRDIRVLEAVAGAGSTFLVDPNMYAFYAVKLYQDTMTPTGDNNNTMTFSLPLEYVDYMGMRKQLLYNTANGPEVAYVNVRYQKTCDAASTDVTGQQMIHNWQFSFAGMFDVAPTADKQGIIKIVKV